LDIIPSLGVAVVVVVDEDDDVPPSRFVKNDLRYLLIINDIHFHIREDLY
jgi:hypothetical protein